MRAHSIDPRALRQELLAASRVAQQAKREQQQRQRRERWARQQQQEWQERQYRPRDSTGSQRRPRGPRASGGHPPPERSHYDTLGVPVSATAGQIRKAYYKIALKHHPDKCAGKPPNEIAASADLFKLAGEAYSVLSDAALRSEYDVKQRIQRGATSRRGGGYESHFSW